LLTGDFDKNIIFNQELNECISGRRGDVQLLFQVGGTDNRLPVQQIQRRPGRFLS